MSRHPAKFTQADIRRALAAAAKVGPDIAVEILPDGRIRLGTAQSLGDAKGLLSTEDGDRDNPWDA